MKKNWFQRIFSENKDDYEPIKDSNLKVCKSCGNKILPSHKYSKQMGLYFHRQCWKNEKRNS